MCVVMIKHIIKDLFLIAMYELGKYVTEQLLIKYTSNDEIDAPKDFASDGDQADLNGVSE